MNTKRGVARCRGITLLELLVVLAMIGILMAVLLCCPGGHPPLLSSMPSTVWTGKSIHQAIFARTLQTIYGQEPDDQYWPRSGATDVTNFQFQTSTEMFIHLVTNGTMSVEFSFFAPYGVKPAQGGHETFQATNNGWCVVGDVDDETYPDNAPFLFTKNLVAFPRMDTPIKARKKEIAPDMMPKDPRVPFGGRQAFVFITKSGSGFGLRDELLKYASFTNLFVQTDPAGKPLTNTVLRP